MENTKLKTSVIIASYNYEQFIKETIESVINQTYTNWELIIIDDGSKDNSVDIIKKYCEKDDRIKLYQHENSINKGLKDTLLLGLEKASCEWVTFLESDDLYKPNYLEEKIKIINQHPNISLIFNDVEIFGDSEEVDGYKEYLIKRQNVFKNPKIKCEDLLTVNLISSFSCVMAKKTVFQTCNFNSPLPQSLDYFLWTQLYNKFKIAYLPKNLTCWRKHNRNYMNEANWSQQKTFDLGILKNIIDKKDNNILVWIYGIIKNKRIEKLFRPQVNFICKKIAHTLLKNKSLEFLTI